MAVVIEENTAIGHQVPITTGNHDFKDQKMPYHNAPIPICRGSWLGSGAFVGPGVPVAEHSIVTAGRLVTQFVPPWKIVRGYPTEAVRFRVLAR